MKIPPHFADTRLGVHIFSGGAGASMLLLGFLMFTFRDYCEPFLRLGLIFLIKHGRRYDPEYYYLYASLPFVLALVFVAIYIFRVATKSRYDRRIDRAIGARLKQSARGAPLEMD